MAGLQLCVKPHLSQRQRDVGLPTRPVAPVHGGALTEKWVSQGWVSGGKALHFPKRTPACKGGSGRGSIWPKAFQECRHSSFKCPQILPRSPVRSHHFRGLLRTLHWACLFLVPGHLPASSAAQRLEDIHQLRVQTGPMSPHDDAQLSCPLNHFPGLRCSPSQEKWRELLGQAPGENPRGWSDQMFWWELGLPVECKDTIFKETLLLKASLKNHEERTEKCVWAGGNPILSHWHSLWDRRLRMVLGRETETQLSWKQPHNRPWPSTQGHPGSQSHPPIVGRCAQLIPAPLRLSLALLPLPRIPALSQRPFHLDSPPRTPREDWSPLQHPPIRSHPDPVPSHPASSPSWA